MHDLAPGSQFASDVRAGLTQPEQKTLGCRYLYDDMGWALREAIALLPEYGLTRADARIIEAHAYDLLDCLPSPLTTLINAAINLDYQLDHGAGSVERVLSGGH